MVFFASQASIHSPCPSQTPTPVALDVNGPTTGRRNYKRGLFKIRGHNSLSKSIDINDRPVDKVEQAKYDW